MSSFITFGLLSYPTNNLVQNLNFQKMFFFFCFFEGSQFLTFLANWYKNLENGKSLSSFFKNSPNIFCQNFAIRKSVKRKFILVLFSWYFYHYVDDRYTMKYYTKVYEHFETMKQLPTLSDKTKPDKIISRTKETKIF